MVGKVVGNCFVVVVDIGEGVIVVQCQGFVCWICYQYCDEWIVVRVCVVGQYVGCIVGKDCGYSVFGYYYCIGDRYWWLIVGGCSSNCY